MDKRDLESYKNELKSQAINLTDLYDSYNNKGKENQYKEKFHIFKVRLAKIARLKDYKYEIGQGRVERGSFTLALLDPVLYAASRGISYCPPENAENYVVSAQIPALPHADTCAG